LYLSLVLVVIIQTIGYPDLGVPYHMHGLFGRKATQEVLFCFGFKK